MHIITSAVYRTSLSRQIVLNVSKHVTHPSLPSKRSTTSDNSQKQVHSTARSIGRHFTQEHQEVLPSLSVQLTWLLYHCCHSLHCYSNSCLVRIYMIISHRCRPLRYFLLYKRLSYLPSSVKAVRQFAGLVYYKLFI